MNKDMLCCVLHGKKDIRLEKQSIPRVKPEEALVKMQRMGICGSDVHYFEHGYAGSFIPKRPFILGHEGAGEVVETGAGVSTLSVGTRVAIDPSQPCYRCNFCMGGRYNLCPGMRFLGSASTDPHMDGVFCEYFTIAARNCRPIPDSLGYAEAALIEPITISMHAVRRAGMIDGASVLIMGGGTIGQLALLIARAFGAGKIAISEMLEERRQLATAQGADQTFNPADASLKDQVMAFTDGGFDVIVEASGAPAALRQAIDLARRGGTIIVVGTLPAEVPLPANYIMTKELQVLGSFRSANVFDQAIQLAASGRMNLKPLITNTLPFSKFHEAIHLASSKGNILKVQVEL